MKEIEMENIIRIVDMTLQYPPADEDADPQTAIDGLSLEIKEGSFVAVLGQNGSGKSTLAKTINALLPPTGGDIFVCGMNTKDDELIWEIRRSAGMVFQNPDNQLVSAVVEDDVAFGPENLGVPTEEIRQRIDDAMKKTGIFEQRKKSPHMLSGGQKQRVAIAGVIAMRPRCILFDEPTAMLDPKGRLEVINIIKALKKEGITVLLITHFMEEAAEADRVIVMRQGKIAADAPPADLFSDTENVRRLGLDLPPAVEIRELLRAGGVDISDDVLDMESLARVLCAGAEVTDGTERRRVREE